MQNENTKHADFLTSLYKAHVKRMWGYAYHLTGDKHLADDVVQTVFTNIIKHGNTLQNLNGTKLKAYLNTSIRNTVSNHKKRVAPVVTALEPEQADSTNLEDTILAMLDFESIRLAMERLSEREKDVITLRYFVDLSYSEIGGIMGLSENHVGVMLHRAIQKLKNVLLSGGDL